MDWCQTESDDNTLYGPEIINSQVYGDVQRTTRWENKCLKQLRTKIWAEFIYDLKWLYTTDGKKRISIKKLMLFLTQKQMSPTSNNLRKISCNSHLKCRRNSTYKLSDEIF